jgi:hypothetical protein
VTPGEETMMLIGSTFYYYRYANRGFERAAAFDSNSPCRVSDDCCAANEVAVWRCANGEKGDVRLAAGTEVRKVYASDAAILAALPG